MKTFSNFPSINVTSLDPKQLIFNILNTESLLKNTESVYFNKVQSLEAFFDINKEYYNKYKKIPTKDTVIEIAKSKNIEILYHNENKDMIDSIYNLEYAFNYDKEWIDEACQKWIKYRKTEISLVKCISEMKINLNDINVYDRIRNIISETEIDFDNNDTKNGYDLFEDFGEDDYIEVEKLSTGYSYIDKCLKGGYRKGSLTIIAGGLKSGKSQWLCNLATRSIINGYNSAYISLEMDEQIVMNRIMSNMLSIKYNDIEEVIKNDKAIIRRKKQHLLETVKNTTLKDMGMLKVKQFPTSATGASDIEKYLLNIEKTTGKKLQVIFIDYINIMMNDKNPKSEITYMKIKQICEDVRAMGIRNEWAIVSLTQTNKESLNSSDVNIEDISESLGLSQTADTVFGIISTPVMRVNGQFFLKCLASRYSDMGFTKKEYKIEWDYLRIKETSDLYYNSNINDTNVAGITATSVEENNIQPNKYKNSKKFSK